MKCLLMFLFCALSSKTVYVYDDYIKQAQSMINIKNYKMAIAPLRRAKSLKSKPFNWEAIKLLGVAYLHLGKHENANIEFKKALQLKPESAEINYYLGFSLASEKKYDKSVKYYERTLAIKPGHYGALTNLAAVHMHRKDTRAAIEVYKQVLVEYPNDFAANYQLGIMMSRTTNKIKAIAYFEKARIVNPKEKKTYKHLIKLYKQNKQVDKADEMKQQMTSL